MRRVLVLLTLAGVLAIPAAAQQQARDTLFSVEKYLDYEQVADAQISPDGSQIVYTRRQVNKLEDRWDASLWIVAADGSRNRFLTKGSSPRWSPDGTRIAFLNDGEPSGTQLFVRYMDAEGATSQVTRVTEPISDLSWSPDGKSLAFSMFVPKSDSWKIDMPEAPDGAKWTPEPKHITSLHYRQDRRGFNRQGFVHLFAVPADGGTPRALTSGDWQVGARFDGQVGGVSYDWSPDGRTIYLVGLDVKDADMNYRDTQIYALDVASGSKRRVGTTDGSWDGVAVSPDGRRIAFTGHPKTTASYRAEEVYVVGTDGSGVQKLSSLDRDPGALHWARDGSGVFFTVAESGTANVYFASVAGQTSKVTQGTHMLSLHSTSRTAVRGCVPARSNRTTSCASISRAERPRRSCS